MTAPGETPHAKKGFWRVSLRGLAVLLPSILTLWILWYAFLFVFQNVAEPINRWIRIGLIEMVPLVTSEESRPDWYLVTNEQVAQYRASQSGAKGVISETSALRQIRAKNFEQLWSRRWYLQVSGLLVAMLLIYLAGALVGGFVGRKVYAGLERLISRVPGFKQVYPYVKQLVDLVLGDKPIAFSRVVLTEFPRKGAWVMGFVTGGGMRMSRDLLGAEALTVFVPTTPTPFTGFTINVRVQDVIDLPISIDEALRYVITGGVLVPSSQSTPMDPSLPAGQVAAAIAAAREKEG